MSTALAVIPVMRPTLGDAEARAAAEAVMSGWVAQGPRVALFESAMAARMEARQGVAVSSCTAALHIALALLEVGPGQEVVVPSLSFIATTNAVLYTGATPVFADVDPNTLNLTVETVGRVLTPRTAAVILVHQAGVPADSDDITTLCSGHGIAVVEDAACAIGATLGGRPVGGHSPLVAFSFHPRKVITTGEGGMLMVRDDTAASRARRLREHGMNLSAAERHASGGAALEAYLETGFNYRMTDIQAAVGLVQLARLEAIVDRRRELGLRYRQLLSGVEGITTTGDPPGGRTNYQSFWVQLDPAIPAHRDDVLGTMAARGVMGRRGIMAAHLEPACAGLAHGHLPVTELATRRSLILPLFHEMTEDEQERVVEVFLDAAGLARP